MPAMAMFILVSSSSATDSPSPLFLLLLLLLRCNDVKKGEKEKGGREKGREGRRKDESLSVCTGLGESCHCSTSREFDYLGEVTFTSEGKVRMQCIQTRASGLF